MSAAEWDNHPPPDNLVSMDNGIPLSLYVAIKYLQSLPLPQRQWSDEQDMKALLLARYPGFVQEALAADDNPPDLIDDKAEPESDLKH